MDKPLIGVGPYAREPKLKTHLRELFNRQPLGAGHVGSQSLHVEGIVGPTHRLIMRLAPISAIDH